MKRSTDGALLDLLDNASDFYRRSNIIQNEPFYPSTAQHRSLNNLTNKTSKTVNNLINYLSTNQEVYRIDVTTDVTVVYQSRQIIFYTTGYTWQPNEVYYILLDSGIATINESCGIESAPINDPHAWVFHIPSTETTVLEERITTKKLLPSISPTKQPISIPRRSCPRWLSFDTILNQSTSANESLFTFCFSVETLLADVVISANTWIPCLTWKLSGAADPLLELYSESNGDLLAQNDDGNSLALTNCYAAVLSYRLEKGDYRVIIRNPKCAYGKFELRLSAETDRHIK